MEALNLCVEEDPYSEYNTSIDRMKIKSVADNSIVGNIFDIRKLNGLKRIHDPINILIPGKQYIAVETSDGIPINNWKYLFEHKFIIGNPKNNTQIVVCKRKIMDDNYEYIHYFETHKTAFYHCP